MTEIFISKKGKNFDGCELNEDNLNAGFFVMYNCGIFETGNRYHRLVELYRNGKLTKVVHMKDIYLLKQ